MSDKDEVLAETTESPSSRRSFLSRFWLGLGGLALVECLWVIGDFLRPRIRKQAAISTIGVIVAGPIERFEPNSVTAFQQGRFYLARLDDGRFVALSRECTHLGCTVLWVAAENRFVCPCHSSAYNAKGDVVSPPAPRALDFYSVRIENGIVKVDTRRPLEGERELTRV